MEWQLVASYFTVKSTDIFYSVYLMNETSIHVPCTWLNI